MKKTVTRWIPPLVSAASVGGVSAGWFIDGQGEVSPEFAARLVEHAVRGKPTAATVETMIDRWAVAKPDLADVAILRMVQHWPVEYSVEVGSAVEKNLVELYEKVTLGSKVALIVVSGRPRRR